MKKMSNDQMKRNTSFIVFIILLIVSFFIFNPAWGNTDNEKKDEKYCWVSGKNFHDLKDAIKKNCKTGDLLWVISNGESINAWNIEQTIGQYCDFKSQIIRGTRADGSEYLQCILLDEKSRKRRVKQ